MGGGRKGEEEKREPVGMAKYFDFQMRVTYVMFKLTVRAATTTTRANFE